MAKYREAPCEFYVCKGECQKDIKDPEHSKKCQTCKKYKPRKGFKSIGNKKRNEFKNKYIN